MVEELSADLTSVDTIPVEWVVEPDPLYDAGRVVVMVVVPRTYSGTPDPGPTVFAGAHQKDSLRGKDSCSVEYPWTERIEAAGAGGHRACRRDSCLPDLSAERGSLRNQ